jgi:hypothetical protein
VPAPSVIARPAPPPEPVSETLEAVITLLGGQVELVRDGQASALAATQTLHAADHLTTKSDARVAAQWGEGSGLLLLGDAQLAIDQLDRHTQRLGITRGEVDVRVGRHQPGEVMKVQANAHIVTVHGTWFTVAADGSRTTVEVLEGEVEVTELDGSASTILRAPARAVFGRGGRVSSGPLEAQKVTERRAQSELNLLQGPELPDFRTATGLFRIAPDPDGGMLAVGGVELGPTPLVVRRPLGRHYIEVTRVHYKPLQRWVSVGPEPGELKVALVRTPTLPPTGEEPVAMEEMIHQRGRQIRGCYERSLKRDPSLNGTVSLRIKVGPIGQVTQALIEPAASTLADAQVATCLEHEALSWHFANGRNATVVYPFVFRPE